jgi:hypothetical protein
LAKGTALVTVPTSSPPQIVVAAAAEISAEAVTVVKIPKAWV